MGPVKLIFIALCIAICFVSINADIKYLEGIIYDEAPEVFAQTSGWNAGTANGGKGFPGTDFEIKMGTYNNSERGLCGPVCTTKNVGNCATLDTDLTPKYAYGDQTSPWHNIKSRTSFYNWFHKTSQNVVVPVSIPMVSQSTSPNIYEYKNDSFFPIDGLGWKDQAKDGGGKLRNFAFCFVARTRFAYLGGEVFNFYGDDDVWVYIDGKMVIDLGALHQKEAANVSLDAIAKAINITVTNRYNLDFFYCERHTTASNLFLTTSIDFNCTYRDACGVCLGDGQSCCTDAMKEQCGDPTNKCIVGFCNVNDNSTCSPKQAAKVCIPSSSCSTVTCLPEKGCVETSGCTSDTCNTRTCTGGQCITSPKCDDGKSCTQDICSSTGKCSQTPVVCTTNACKVWSMNNATAGCCTFVGDYNCDDNDPCTVDTCNPSATVGSNPCIHTPLCDSKTDPCNPDLCVKSGGNATCVTTPPCTAPNKCTTTTCAKNTTATNGYTCTNKAKACTTTNLCSPSSCSLTTGTCVTQAKTCNDNLFCTIDSCNATTGNCTFVPNTCDDGDKCTNDTCTESGCVNTYVHSATCPDCSSNADCDDGNTCTTDMCNAATKACVHTKINNCVQCGTKNCTWTDPCNPQICNSTTQCQVSAYNCGVSNKCTTNKCTNLSGVASCTTDTVNCNVTDKCNPQTCDDSKGCVANAVTCPARNCKVASCSSATGLCQYTSITCLSDDPCNPKTCNEATGVCEAQPFCSSSGKTCTDTVCAINNSTNKPECSYPDTVCPDGDCGAGACNATTGACYVAIPDCDDNTDCTTDSLTCAGPDTTCNHVPSNICDDNNNCTNEYCDITSNSTSPCQYTNVTCTPRNLCETVSPTCNSTVGGCVYEPIVCPGSNDVCKVVSCDLTYGCLVEDKICLPKDSGCYKAVCDSSQPDGSQCKDVALSNWISRTSTNGVVCSLRYDAKVRAAAISTGAAVGIAIAAAAGAGIVGYGGKKGYDHWKNMQNQRFDGVQNNPLYEENAGAADNPIYRHSAAL